MRFESFLDSAKCLAAVVMLITAPLVGQDKEEPIRAPWTQEERTYLREIQGKTISCIPARGAHSFYFGDEKGTILPEKGHPIRTMTLQCTGMTKSTVLGKLAYGLILESVQGPNIFRYIAWSTEPGLPIVSKTIFNGGFYWGDPLKYTEDVNLKIVRHEAWVGMTEEQAKLSIGEPDEENTTKVKGRTATQWVYETHRADGGDDSYGISHLYFEKGKCSGIQLSRRNR